MRRQRQLVLVLASLLALVAAPALAAVKLPVVIGDNMVLQRDQPVPLWGWDDPGTEVTVALAETTAKAKADENGKWTVKLPALKAGGPFTLTVSGTDKAEVKNVLVGEVWFCSGQSNMEWRVRQSKNAQEEVESANHPRIRHIKIPHVPAEEPQQNVPSDGWEVCSPETVGNFTAVGYFFGRHLQQELDVPIGLIGCNWGGTRIEPWTPPAGFQQVPALKQIADNLDSFPKKNKDGKVQHQTALALYNGMVSPLVPYAVRGFLWYQGESNRGDAASDPNIYHEKMKALISGWRTVWDNEDLPFYFVQLAPYRYGGDPQLLPRIWECQTKTLSVPNTGMAVTVDIGNVKDIHPRNKQDVGKRLALWALAKTYGHDDIVYSGPLYKSMKVEGDSVRLSFEHTADGLKTLDGKAPTWFSIAGKDQEFVEAEAKIDGDTVVVHSKDVKQPVAVRYGWHQEAEPNLANSAGLPASPFRTGVRD